MLANIWQVGFRRTRNRCELFEKAIGSSGTVNPPLPHPGLAGESDYVQLKQAQVRKQQATSTLIRLTPRLLTPRLEILWHICFKRARSCAATCTLAAQWSHSFTLRLCSRERIYNINTEMCHKTHHCFQSTCIQRLWVWAWSSGGLCWGYGEAHLVVNQQRETTFPPPVFWYFCISWLRLHAWVL